MIVALAPMAHAERFRRKRCRTATITQTATGFTYARKERIRMALAAKLSWKILGTVSAVAATMAAQKLINATWTSATGKQPPTSPETPDITAFEAVSWVVASGAGVAVARLLATRKAAEYWHKSTGNMPPGMKMNIVPPETLPVSARQT
jgi:hypothetical protein